jgi:hypothetical protein
MQSRAMFFCLVIGLTYVLSIHALVAGGNNMWNGDAKSLKRGVRLLIISIMSVSRKVFRFGSVSARDRQSLYSPFFSVLL